MNCNNLTEIINACPNNTFCDCFNSPTTYFYFPNSFLGWVKLSGIVFIFSIILLLILNYIIPPLSARAGRID